LTLKKPAFLSAEVKVGENVTHVVADGQTAFTDTSTDKTRYIKQSAHHSRNLPGLSGILCKRTIDIGR
jgi:hypothetical protein